MKATGNSADLRKRAETFLEENLDAYGSKDETGIRELLHELSVHQVELELQNEELEKARAEAEGLHARYFSLYDLAPVGFAGIGYDGTVKDINLTGASFLGRERRYIVGRRFQMFIRESDFTVFSGFLQRVFIAGSKEQCEVSTGTNGREHRVLLIEGMARKGENNTGECRVALIDITGRRKAEQDLRASNRNLAMILDSAPGPIVVWDRNLRITLFNRAFSELTGRHAEKMVGQPLAFLFPEEQRSHALDLIRHAPGGRLEGAEIPIIAFNGERRTVLWNSVQVPGAVTPEESFSVAQGQDITEQKRALDELILVNQDLSATNKRLISMSEELQGKEAVLRESLAEKEVLLSEIHHRVKNNLAAFISLISLRGSCDDSPEGARMRQDLQNRARSMALIHETLYRTGQYSHVDMDMYLKVLVNQVAAGYTIVPVSLGIAAGGISLDIPRATPCGLIVNELVTNAFKYAFLPESNARQPAPAISVVLEENGDSYILTVRDNGRGLADGFRIEDAKTLGLRLVRFLALHQLHAPVTCRNDSGTVFEVQFPKTPL